MITFLIFTVIIQGVINLQLYLQLRKLQKREMERYRSGALGLVEEIERLNRKMMKNMRIFGESNPPELEDLTEKEWH